MLLAWQWVLQGVEGYNGKEAREGKAYVQGGPLQNISMLLLLCGEGGGGGEEDGEEDGQAGEDEGGKA